MTPIGRGARFALVSAMGSVVQLGALAALVGLGASVMAATTAGVAAAVLHNYVWHRRWTWRDRDEAPRWITGLAAFALANGAVSLGGNLAVMTVLVDGAGIAPVAAGVVAIGACGLVNLHLADRAVFVRHPFRRRSETT